MDLLIVVMEDDEVEHIDDSSFVKTLWIHSTPRTHSLQVLRDAIAREVEDISNVDWVDCVALSTLEVWAESGEAETALEHDGEQKDVADVEHDEDVKLESSIPKMRSMTHDTSLFDTSYWMVLTTITQRATACAFVVIGLVVDDIYDLSL
jgi:hypothetical protein